jgi:predicted NBD/HSP70 family sugar kinase
MIGQNMQDDNAACPAAVGPRERTREAVFQLIRNRPGTTRSHIADELGIVPTTVNDVVRRLIDSGRVIEHPYVPTDTPRGRGRPSTRLEVAVREGHVAGIDFGHSHVAVGIGDTRGRRLAEQNRLMDVDQDVAGAMDLGTAMLWELAAELGVRTFEAAAACVPQPIDPITGRVEAHRIRSDWGDLIPRDLLAERLGMPISVDNDANIGALGELRSGAGQDADSFLYVKVSTGIGAALVVNGRPYFGSHGLAGEIGHVPIPGHSERCRCGARGCLETAVSVTAVFDHLKRMGLDPGRVDGFAELAKHPVLDRALQDSGRILGEILSSMCNMLAPSLIIIGGWLGAMASEPIMRGTRTAIADHSHPAIARHIKVRPAGHGYHSEVIGTLHRAADAVPSPTRPSRRWRG